MIQTGLIPNAHSDLITDASYDFYGLRLATCGLDQRIKIHQLDESAGLWAVEDDWKAHDAAISKISWAHPEFGSIIASSSFDRTVKIWEQTSAFAPANSQQLNGNVPQPSTSRWTERAVLVDARGTVRSVEFAPHHFGLKLATISTDNHLRIYECVEQPSLLNWHLCEEIDVQSLQFISSPAFLSRANTVALATPTQSHSSLEGASASLVAQALQQGLQQQQQSTRPGLGNREADGGWCISWCKDRYWGEIIASGCGISGTVKIIQLSASRRPITLLTLDPSPAPTTAAASSASASAPTPNSNAIPNSSTLEPDSNNSNSNTAHGPTPGTGPTPYAITSVSWAPSCGRSYHLIATGGRDGRVRIWKVRPAADDVDAEGVDTEGGGDDGKWTATVVADFDQHKSAVGRVEWNITGTVLSSAGNDGRIRLWKATSGNVWRPAGSIGVEQAEPTEAEANAGKESGDVDME